MKVSVAIECSIPSRVEDFHVLPEQLARKEHDYLACFKSQEVTNEMTGVGNQKEALVAIANKQPYDLVLNATKKRM